MSCEVVFLSVLLKNISSALRILLTNVQIILIFKLNIKTYNIFERYTFNTSEQRSWT